MSVTTWIKRQLTAASAPAVQQRTGKGRPTRKRATYDSAQTTDENRSHWAAADGLNANAAHSPWTRQVIRERARYERDNNCHAGGLVAKIARDLIGTGPRLQLTLPDTWTDPDFGVEQVTPKGAAREIERLFANWCRSIGLARKLRVMAEARQVDGESFAVMVTNPRLPEDGPQLDIRLYETDQIHTPWYAWGDPLAFDGGRLDELGNVTEWHFLKAHPGSGVWFAGMYDYEPIPAERVIHWFKARRAGQLRGVSEMAGGLTLYGQLRRLTLATLTAAEVAANFAGVLETDIPPAEGEEDAAPIESADQIPIPRGALPALSYGWKLSSFDAKQPTASYRDFKGELLTEAGSGQGAPRNASTNSSAEYNYSSGRLDHLPYERGIVVERSDLREIGTDRLFAAWLDEAEQIEGYLPEGLPPRHLWTTDWHFDGFDSIDPKKDAETDAIELASNTTTLAEVYARKGKDWEEALRQRAREMALIAELGLKLSAPPPPMPEVSPDGAEQTAEA